MWCLVNSAAGKGKCTSLPLFPFLYLITLLSLNPSIFPPPCWSSALTKSKLMIKSDALKRSEKKSRHIPASIILQSLKMKGCDPSVYQTANSLNPPPFFFMSYPILFFPESAFFYSRLNPSLPQPLWPPKWKGHVNMQLCVQSCRRLSLVCRPIAIWQLLLKLGLELTSEERPHHLLFD